MRDEIAEAESHGAERADVLVLLNQISGEGRNETLKPELERLFSEEKLSVVVEEYKGEALAERVKNGFEESLRIIVAGGGDGTIHLVAAALVDTEHVLGVLPLGTVNLFARSLNIPLDLKEAVAVITQGVDTDVDLCEANENIVLTNVSAGLYAEITADRERRRRKHRHWPRLIRWTVDTCAAFSHAAKRWWRGGLMLRVDDEPHYLPTRLFAASNCEYEGWTQAERRGDGRLSVLIPDPRPPLPTFWTALKVALLGPRHVPEVKVRLANEVDVIGKGSVKTVIDGEVQNLALPLHIRPRPKALRVRVPTVRE